MNIGIKQIKEITYGEINVKRMRENGVNHEYFIKIKVY